MPIFDLYSKRQKRAAQTSPDVYSYDDIPTSLKVQIVHIWNDSLGMPNQDQTGNVTDTYHMIVGILRREYGVFRLSEKTLNPHDASYAYNELLEFFLKSKVSETLD